MYFGISTVRSFWATMAWHDSREFGSSPQARSSRSSSLSSISLSELKPSYGLSDDEIARMLQESFTTAEQDMKARALAEAKVEADRMLLATQSALDVDGQLLRAEERARIESQMQQLRAIAQSSSDAGAIEAATEAVAKGTEAFAAARMNHSIQQALAGKNVESL